MAYCQGCGSELEPGAKYCGKCGRPAGEEPIGEQIGRDVSDAIRDSLMVERIPEIGLIDALFGGLVVILLGGVLYLAATGSVSWLEWSNFWAYFLLGLGVLLLLKGAAEFAIRPARRKAAGDLNGGVVLAIIGGVFVYVFEGGDIASKWPLLIVIVGLVVIAGAIVAYMMRKSFRP